MVAIWQHASNTYAWPKSQPKPAQTPNSRLVARKHDDSPANGCEQAGHPNLGTGGRNPCRSRDIDNGRNIPMTADCTQGGNKRGQLHHSRDVAATLERSYRSTRTTRA